MRDGSLERFIALQKAYNEQRTTPMTDVTQADREPDILVVSGSPPDIRDAINRSHAAADARIAALEEENARLRAVHTVNYELQRHMQTLVAGIHSAIEQLKILPYRCSKTEMIEQRLKKCLASKPATTALGEQP